MLFYLGTHRPEWLRKSNVPLFISRRRLCKIKTIPKAERRWALDSGAFTEISMFGGWTVTPRSYAEEVACWQKSVGNLDWAAIQDYPCEPHVLKRVACKEGVIKPDLARLAAMNPMPEWADFMATKIDFDMLVEACPDLTSEQTEERIKEHQRRTVRSYLELRDLDPALPWVPVLQGWQPQDYLDHRDQYLAAGVDLAALPLVGLGSVCRRQSMGMVEMLIRRLHGDGIKLHLFGFKLNGLRRCARYATSSDSMAWSFNARRSPPLPGCTHKSCANCMKYALWWRDKVLRAVEGSLASEQGLLFGES